MTKSRSSIKALARDIADAMPALSALDRHMAVFIYRTLITGSPVPVDAIAAYCDETPSGVVERLTVWPGVGRDDQGAVVSFWGLALEGMPHRFEVDGKALTTWCAWDAFFIPGIIDQVAKVRSTCPVSGESVALRISPHGVSDVSPSTAAVSIQRPLQLSASTALTWTAPTIPARASGDGRTAARACPRVSRSRRPSGVPLPVSCK